MKVREALLRKLLITIFLFLLIVAGACKKATQGSADEQDIKKSLETYLTQKKHINLQSVKLEYKNLQLAQDRATVDVLFQSGDSKDMTIGFRYTLKKSATGWEVEKGEATSGSMFGGHTGTGGTPATGEAQLPPGHPAMAPPSEGASSAAPHGAGMEPAHKKDTPKK
jgi:hypothetical protein